MISNSGKETNLAAVLAVFSSLFFSMRSVLIKMAPSVNPEIFVFFRFLFDFIILIPIFIKYRSKLHTKRINFFFWRSILIVLSIYCSVYGLQHLALVDAILLQYTLPLFIPLISWIVNRKKITRRSAFFLCLGFFSLFFILKPEFDMIRLASLASIGAGFLGAIMALMSKELTKTEPIVTFLFFGTLLCGLMSFPPVVYSWETVPSSLWIYLVLISVVGTIHQYLITKAYHLGEPYVVGSFVYFTVLFSALLGWWIWKEAMEPIQLIGGFLLILSGIFIVRENSTTPEAEEVH